MNLGRKSRFRLENNDVFGLDIGSSQVKLVQLRRESNGWVVSAASAASVRTTDDGNATEGQLTRAIEECVESSRLQTRFAVCGLSGPEVAVRHFNFPPMVEAELEGAILLEADQVCPFSVAKSTVDYQLVPNGDESTRGVLVAATNQLINTREQLVKSASLNCVLMDVEGLALLNCLEALDGEHKAEGANHKTGAILNVGNSRTTLAIMGCDGLPFVREIACAGNDIIERIARDHNMDAQRVRQIMSGASQGESELQLGDSLVDACEDLINDVNETLRFYTTRDKSTFVGKIYVCGGFALVKGLVGLLDSQLSARAALWNPFEHCAYDAEQSLKDTLSKTGPSFAVAAGFAVRSI